MCLAIPARVTRMDGDMATVEVGGVELQALHLRGDLVHEPEPRVAQARIPVTFAAEAGNPGLATAAVAHRVAVRRGKPETDCVWIIPKSLRDRLHSNANRVRFG